MVNIPIRSTSITLIALREVDDSAEVLLLRRNHSVVDEWCLVAGTLQDDEAAWQAALRQLTKETGLTPTRFYSGDICEQSYEADRDAITIVPVFVAYVAYDAPVVLNPAYSEYQWVSLDWAEDMVAFGGQRRVLRHVKQEFVLRDPSPRLRIMLA